MFATDHPHKHHWMHNSCSWNRKLLPGGWRVPAEHMWLQLHVQRTVHTTVRSDPTGSGEASECYHNMPHTPPLLRLPANGTFVKVIIDRQHWSTAEAEALIIDWAVCTLVSTKHACSPRLRCHNNVQIQWGEARACMKNLGQTRARCSLHCPTSLADSNAGQQRRFVCSVLRNKLGTAPC